MVLLDLVGALEEKARLAGLDHAQVVVAVSGGNGVIAHGLQGLHRGELGLLTAHLKAGDLPVGGHLQAVAEDGGPAQLAHQGLGKLLKGVAEDDHLGHGAQLIQKLLGPGQGVDLGDGGLDLLETQPVLLQDTKAPAHQLVVVGLIPGGALELGNAALLGKGDPDLGDQNALHIQTGDIHGSSSSFAFRLVWPHRAETFGGVIPAPSNSEGSGPDGLPPRRCPSWRRRSRPAHSPRPRGRRRRRG